MSGNTIDQKPPVHTTGSVTRFAYNVIDRGE